MHFPNLLYSAPLPFLGQKRNWINCLPDLLHGNLFESNFSPFINKGIFVDLFGGSGLLSYNIKQLCPKAEVIYNDFDGFSDYLNDEHLSILKEIGKPIAKILDKYHKEQREKNTRFDEQDELFIKKLIQEFKNKYGDKIYLRAIYAPILFSAGLTDSIERMEKSRFWYKDRGNVTYKFEKKIFCNYVKDLTVYKHTDFKLLLDKYKDNENAILIADPPYLNTASGTYKSGFEIENYNYLLENLRPPFIGFSSNKNDFVKILKKKYPTAKIIEFNVNLGQQNNNRKESDIIEQMIYCVK